MNSQFSGVEGVEGITVGTPEVFLSFPWSLKLTPARARAASNSARAFPGSLSHDRDLFAWLSRGTDRSLARSLALGSWSPAVNFKARFCVGTHDRAGCAFVCVYARVSLSLSPLVVTPCVSSRDRKAYRVSWKRRHVSLRSAIIPLYIVRHSLRHPCVFRSFSLHASSLDTLKLL